MKNIHHLPVWVCTLLGMLIPMVWYGLFATPWMELNGLTTAEINRDSNSSMYLSAFMSSLIGSYVLGWLWYKLNISTGSSGLVTALILGFGLVFLPMMVHNMFAFRPYGLTWIDGGQTLLWLAVSGFILGIWKKKKA